MHELSAAWLVNHRLTLDLLKATPARALQDRYSERTSTVASQFAHIHFIRVKHVEGRDPEYEGGLATFSRGADVTKKALRDALKASGEALTRLVERLAVAGAVPRWGGNSPTSYLGYLVAHEAHHRALIIASLRVGGHQLGKDVTSSMWHAWRRAGPKSNS